MRNYFIALIVSLQLLGCGESFKNEDTVEDVMVLAEEDHGYELDNYFFTGNQALGKDKVINANKVVFYDDSRLKIRNFNLTIEANEIVFQEGSKIIGFEESETANCSTNGKHSGDLSINAKEISGKITVDLKGENSGIFGYYVTSNEPLVSSHKNRDGYFYQQNCPTKFNIEWQELDPLYKSPTNGGDSGDVYIDEANKEFMGITFINSVSLGSPNLRVEIRAKNQKANIDIKEGEKGKIGKYCYLLNEGDVLCR